MKVKELRKKSSVRVDIRYLQQAWDTVLRG